VLHLLRRYRLPLSSKEILASAGGGREAVERILSSLVERGTVERLEGPRATLYFAKGPS
jgi:DNA-binding IclR family transcriptional regulator